MGIELDVLVGHPEHDLLFVATQVCVAAGLKKPSNRIKQFRSTKEGLKGPMLTLGGLVPESGINVPEVTTESGIKRALRSSMAMVTESEAYIMLLRGNCPASEPFRKWVTEEVLPTIRKTGSYDAEKSSNPIAVDLT